MSGRSRFPFTAAQWKELEHKAPVFKYMISGTPIPPDLLFSIKRNSYDCQEGGWSYSLLGMKKVDPEPGRCRRTDGKKWRCSKEAYADSKYCVTHICIEAKIVQESLWNSTPLTPANSSLINILYFTFSLLNLPF